MDETHSLLLNEEAFRACPDAKKAVFVYEWLRYLDRILPVTQRADLKTVQKELQKQLESRLNSVSGPPTRQLLARCIARVYLLGDSSALFGTINACNDTLRVKDDSPVLAQSKLAALSCLAALYESAGRLVGRTFEDSFVILQKWMKSAESHNRAHIMNTLTSMVRGIGSGGSSVHKDVYKLAKTFITDRASFVKVAAAECLTALVPLYTPLYTIELEAACTLCVKAFDGANYELRFSVAQFMATLIATSLQPPPGAMISVKSNQPMPVKPAALEDSLQLMANGFLRGGIGGFLKGSSGGVAVVGGQKDIRVGVAMAHVEMMRELGPTWLEKNLGTVCQHLVELAAKCGHLAYTTSPAQLTEAMTLRRCISYILRSTIGTMLGENAQLAACKHLGALLAHHINNFECTAEPGVERSLGSDSYASSHAATVVLLELSVLVRQIGTAVTPLFVEASGIMEPVFACLLHPVLGARIATAWCLRCVAIALPSLLTPLIDRCISRLEHMKASADAISGYSLALAALVAASADCKLGIPHAKPLQILCCAEDMLKTATQQSRIAIAKIEAGWNLIHALVSLGSPTMKDFLPRIIRLWRAAFPRSPKEAEAEKSRGDSFSWQCAMVAQAGALSVMAGVATHPELASHENAISAMLLPIECSLVMMSQVGSLIRSYGSRMRQLNSLVRIRVYRLLMLIPPRSYESCYVHLLRELVADITLSDNAQSTLMTSVPNEMCSGAEQVLLSPWLRSTDQAMVEDLLESHTSDIGSMEDDVTSIVSSSASRTEDLWPEKDSAQLECLDAAIHAFGRVFPLVASKHKVQVTDHFAEVVKNSKQPARQQAIHLNALSATMLAYKSLCEQRGPRVDNEQLQKASVALIAPALSSTTAVTRFVAAEALARLAQAVAVPQFVASMAQYCFDNLRGGRDASTRAGHALALGCLHRHVGSLGSGQHLNTGFSIVLALAQDINFPVVQSWALVAMALIAETGGGMFRGFVELVLSVCLKLLLSTPSANVEVVQGIGKLLTALITCVGPELACAGVIDGVRTSLLAACAIQLAHPDPSVRAEAISGLQQMHLFAPRYVHLSQLVVDICSLLSSEHLSIRRAAVCCLRQLVQQEAKEVREHAQVLVPQGIVDESRKLPLPDTGLEGALFGMLDSEVHPELKAHVQETLVSLVQGTSGELLNNWLLLCKDILATSNDNTRSTLIVEDKTTKSGANGATSTAAASGGGDDDDDDDDDDGGDDDTTLAGAQTTIVDKGRLQPRWPTKVFAMEVVQRLMNVCDTERAHLDLALAKELQMTSNGRCDYLVLHLSDLVRMSFMGATSDNSQLRLAGLRSLQDVINRFSTVPEPEFPGHVILEQFQAQVGAALRPAFTDDTPSHVTAAACQVCSTWIGSGVARDLNDLRRVHHLLVSSLSKLKHGSINTQLFSESAATLEKLSILKAWAEVYVTAVHQEASRTDPKADELNDNHEDVGCHESLLSLVGPELDTLISYWLAALHDATLLSLPPQYADQLPAKGGTFFTLQSAEVCREYYRTSWPPILLATATWLNTKNFELPSSVGLPSVWVNDGKESRFYLLLGIAIEALSNRTNNFDDVTVQMALRSITSLVSCEWCQLHLMSEVVLAVELLNVLHRLILTRDNLTTQALCVECASAVVDAARSAMRVCSSRDVENGNVESSVALPATLFAGDEGGDGGAIAPPAAPPTISYAALELCLCTIVRQMPQINAAQMRSRSLAPLHLRRIGRLTAESSHLVVRSIQLLVQIPTLCSPQAKIETLPVVMYLLVGFIRESATIDEHSVVPILPQGHLTAIAASALQAIRTLASAPPADETLDDWKMILRSAFYSILILADGDARSVDQCVVMLAAVVLATSAPCDVITAHHDSFHHFVALLKRQLASEHVAVVVKALQSITSIFSRRAFGGTFVRHLARDVFLVIRPFVTPVNGKVQQLVEADVGVIQEAIKAVEVLAAIADEKKRIQLVSLLIQSLVRLLRATSSDEWRQLNNVDRKLHEAAITRLNVAASLWPKEFKKVVEWNSELKNRLEKALMLQSSRHAMVQSARAKAAEIENATSTVVQPKIKLMDFNAFSKAAS